MSVKTTVAEDFDVQPKFRKALCGKCHKKVASVGKNLAKAIMAERAAANHPTKTWGKMGSASS